MNLSVWCNLMMTGDTAAVVWTDVRLVVRSLGGVLCSAAGLSVAADTRRPSGHRPRLLIDGLIERRRDNAPGKVLTTYARARSRSKTSDWSVGLPWCLYGSWVSVKCFHFKVRNSIRIQKDRERPQRDAKLL